MMLHSSSSTLQPEQGKEAPKKAIEFPHRAPWVVELLTWSVQSSQLAPALNLIDSHGGRNLRADFTWGSSHCHSKCSASVKAAAVTYGQSKGTEGVWHLLPCSAPWDSRLVGFGSPEPTAQHQLS